jgi:hypothetical protein
MWRGKLKRGSVLLMVIGLLTIIAMLGSMLLLVSRLDRQTSQAIATVAPETHVAEGILDRLLANRLADLYINDANGPYGNLDPNILIAERQMIDYPAEPNTGIVAIDPNIWFDNALACIEPNSGNFWRHVSYLPGCSYSREPNDVDGNSTDPNVVDTDGDGFKDALLFPTGIMDLEGGTFFAAVRMIDAAGLLNANLAGASTRNAATGQIMDANDLALQGLMSSTAAIDVVNARGTTGPYDMSDMLALHWLDPDNEPNTVNGRLVDTVINAGGNFIATRGSLTTVSTSTTRSPLWIWSCRNLAGMPSPPAGNVKVNPNDPNRISDPNAYLQQMYDTFLTLLHGNDNRVPVESRRKAAQLTVNLIDYLDTDPNVTRIDASTLDSNFSANPYFYGVERHPFVSKVFRKRIYVDPNIDPDADPNDERSVAAFELINPYVEGIKLDNYKIQGGTLWTDKIIPGNGGRFVVYSDATIQIDSSVKDPESRQQLAFDANNPIKIMWAHPSDGWEICVDEAPRVEPDKPTETEPNHFCAMFRDDVLSNACYSLVNYKTVSDSNDPNYDYTDPSRPKMGEANPETPAKIDPNYAPVYVRNGPLISLGDMMRVLTVGPSDANSLTERLTGQAPTELWLVPHAASVPPAPNIAQPSLPAGCVLSEFFDLLTDPIYVDSNHNLHGLININTAPASVLKCLPGLASLPDANRQAMAEEIIAYRDKQDMSLLGGRNYTVRGPLTGPINITRLREQPGFACAGEVAIPLRMATEARSLIFSCSLTPPNHYPVGDPPPSDDGLPIDGNAVMGDLVKKYVLYTWLANQVTVRSNTFIAYIRVQRSKDVNAPARCYVAVIDRGNCKAATDRPRVLMFTELR